MKNFTVRSLLFPLALGAAAALSLPMARSAVLGGGRTMAYPEAVRHSRMAAEAVLARSGTESCLRGKLNRAVLGLSASCEAAAERSPLCTLADKAAVVTPMTLAFMDETARRLLELSTPEAASPGVDATLPLPQF
jgi:hypothetical protein